MPQTIETTVYLFNELPTERAKEKALEWGRENVLWDEWYQCTTEHWENELLPKLGFTNCKISFSGFWSQGDGASFVGGVDFLKYCDAFGVSLRPLVRKLIEKGVVSVIASIDRNSHHYYHENTVSVNWELDGLQYRHYSGNVVNYLEKICGGIQAEARSKMREIYRDLEKEYEHLTSDESVKDFLESNEYTFTESGKRFG